MLYYNQAIFIPFLLQTHPPPSFTAAMTLVASCASEMIVSAMVMRWWKSATPGTGPPRKWGGSIRMVITTGVYMVTIENVFIW